MCAEQFGTPPKGTQMPFVVNSVKLHKLHTKLEQTKPKFLKNNKSS